MVFKLEAQFRYPPFFLLFIVVTDVLIRASDLVSDIDECSKSIHKCSNITVTCSNTVGAFQCVCKPRFIGDGHNCIGTYQTCSVFRTCLGEKSTNLPETKSICMAIWYHLGPDICVIGEAWGQDHWILVEFILTRERGLYISSHPDRTGLVKKGFTIL